MLKNETKIRVRYSETDRMGYVYYGNYAAYFEVARVETLRNIGISYKVLEDDGLMLPVLSYSIKYFKPAYYDDELLIKTYINELPKMRIHFAYETYGPNGDLLNKAETTLVFVDIKSKKPCMAPEKVLKTMRSYFSSETN